MFVLPEVSQFASGNHGVGMVWSLVNEPAENIVAQAVQCSRIHKASGQKLVCIWTGWSIGKAVRPTLEKICTSVRLILLDTCLFCKDMLLSEFLSYCH